MCLYVLCLGADRLRQPRRHGCQCDLACVNFVVIASCDKFRPARAAFPRHLCCAVVCCFNRFCNPTCVRLHRTAPILNSVPLFFCGVVGNLIDSLGRSLTLSQISKLFFRKSGQSLLKHNIERENLVKTGVLGANKMIILLEIHHCFRDQGKYGAASGPILA